MYFAKNTPPCLARGANAPVLKGCVFLGEAADFAYFTRPRKTQCISVRVVAALLTLLDTRKCTPPKQLCQIYDAFYSPSKTMQIPWRFRCFCRFVGPPHPPVQGYLFNPPRAPRTKDVGLHRCFHPWSGGAGGTWRYYISERQAVCIFLRFEKCFSKFL